MFLSCGSVIEHQSGDMSRKNTIVSVASELEKVAWQLTVIDS